MERKHPLAKCEECPLAKEACAPTVGPKDAKVAVVSRSPGYYEAKKGIPFSGPSGKVLDYLLKQEGLDRDEVLLTNVVLCTTEKPPVEAIEACSPRLQSELHNAHTIIAAGGEATTELIGSKSVGGNRGYAHRRANGTGKLDQRVIVTNNPAIVLKDDKKFLDLVKDFKLAINPTPSPVLPKVTWTNDTRKAKDFLTSIVRTRYGYLSADIESFGLRHTAKLASIAFSADGSKAVSFGVNVVNDDTLMRDFIRPLLQRDDCKYIWHNGKFDVRNLRAKEINARVDEDTLLLSYALDERSDEHVHGLDYLLMDNLAWPHYEPNVVRQWKSKVGNLERQGKYEELDELEVPDELYEYNALDAAGCYQLYETLKERVVADGVLAPYEKLLIPGSEALVRVELQGMHYDVHEACNVMEREVEPHLVERIAELQTKVGDGSYNPRSPQQNSKLVYDDWMLLPDVAERREKERSVDKPVYTAISRGEFVIGAPIASTYGEAQLQQLRLTAEEWAKLLIAYKELDYVRGHYLEGLIYRAIRANGRVYTDFKEHGTSTGRLSSSNPNLQNIIRPKEGLPNIRRLFLPSEGNVILNADFSQAEMRVIAYLSNDPKLVDIYRKGISLHRMVAERFYGPDYTKEQYNNSKNMDFGVAYGQSARTFLEKHDIPEKEGEAFIKWWYQEFASVKDLQREIHKEAFTNGFVQSPSGRKRRFYLITDQNKNEIKREAFNFIPQNTASEFTLYSVINLVCRELNPIWGSVVLTVHDSIVGDIREDYVSEAATVFKQVMESSVQSLLGWNFPFTAEVSVGPNWADLEEIAA